jgi:DNA-binding transcriptional ArsR family regulator
MQLTEIIITNILASRSAFAVHADDMAQNVYIPSHLMQDERLQRGMTVSALLAPNVTRPDKTQWLAIRIEPRGPAQHPIAARILEDMQQGPATASEISESISVPDGTVQLHLNALFEQGQLNREYLYDITTKGV